MALQDITITASIDSFHTTSYGQTTYLASSDDQSYPLEEVIGGYTAWPTFVEDENYTTNLFVNVTQSWSSSYDSPVGTILTVHNTMEEFVNGEFSGSVLDTVGQRLIDPNCEAALRVGTTPLSYNIFPFFKVYGSSTGAYNAFLNRNTTPSNGEAYIAFDNTFAQAKGQYAKIAKRDALGNDNTLSLQQLTTFSYIDSNAGKIVFTISNITEYPTYFYYDIGTTTYATSLPAYDDNYEDFTVNASYSSATVPAFNVLSNLWGTWTVTNDPQSGFDASDGAIIFSKTPNTLLNFTASITFTNASPFIPNFALNLSQITPSPQFIRNVLWPGNGTSLSAGTHTVTISGSFNDAYNGCKLMLFFANSVNITSVSSTYTITQIATPQSATTPFILEPYLTSTYNYTDCDVLVNNAIQNDINDFRRRVLYENGSLVPSNFNQIISGTAELAELNDYLYDANANYRPRYQGVRSTSPGVNLSTTEGGYGTLPNIENLQTYFAYFDFMQTTNSELLEKSAAHIKYLIDKDGIIQTPTLTGSYYANLIDNFETDKKANIVIYNENGDKVTIGNKTILRPGALPRAILESQVAFDPTVVNGISFGTSNNNASGLNYSYNFIAGMGPPDDSVKYMPPFGSGQGGDVIPLTVIISGSNSEVVSLTGNNAIKFKKGNTNYLVSLRFTLVATRGAGAGPFTPLISFQHSDDDGTSWTTFYEDSQYVFQPSNSTNIYFTPPFSPVANRLYRVYYSDDPGSGGIIYVRSTHPNSTPAGRTMLEVLDISGGTNPNAILNYQSTYNLNGYNVIYRSVASPQFTSPFTYSYISVLSPNVRLVPGGNGWIEIVNTSGGSTLLNFEFSANFGPDLGNGSDCRVIFYLQKSTNSGATWTSIEVTNPYVVGVHSGNIGNLPQGVSRITFNSAETPVAGTYYRVQGRTVSAYGTWAYSSSLNVTQTAVSTLNNATIAVFNLTSSIYWTTGSSSSNILTSSYFAPYWTGDSGYYTQNSISELYGPNLPFTIKPYTDQIRFMANELETYTITDAYFDPNFTYTPGNPPTGSLIVTLNNNVSPNVNINSFLIRRYHPNASYVTMDSEYISGSGFLIPQYITNDIRDNFDKIIIDLKERTLI